MKTLKKLILSLHQKEQSFIRHYYKFNEDKLRLKLFDLIAKGKVNTDKEAASLLYGEKGPAYSHLKSRLQNDILKLLLFEDGKKQSKGERFQSEVDAIRLYLQGKILLNRKNEELGIKVLNKALDKTNDYGLSIEKLLIKDILSHRVGLQSGLQAYNNLMDNFEDQIKIVRDLFRVKSQFFNVSLPQTFYKNKEKEYIELSKQTLAETQKLVAENNNPEVLYYYYQIAINHYSLTHDYINLFSIANLFLELVLNNKSIQTRVRISNAYMHVVISKIYLEQYLDAISAAEKAIQFVVPGGVNEIRILEYLFLAALQTNDYSLIQHYLDKGLIHPRVKSASFTNGKWQFYAAIASFKQEKYQDCLGQLLINNELLKDKAGWLFGFRLIEIMTFIELEQYDMIEFRVEALRKLLQRQKDKNIIRIKLIVSILHALIKTGFQFENCYQKETKKFQLLQEAEDDYRWNPLGYEIIRFDAWFQSQLR